VSLNVKTIGQRDTARYRTILTRHRAPTHFIKEVKERVTRLSRQAFRLFVTLFRRFKIVLKSLNSLNLPYDQQSNSCAFFSAILP